MSRGGCGKECGAAWDIIKLAVPLLATNAFNTIADRWTLAFVGHWDYVERAHYDGLGLGKMYSNITGLSIGVASTVGLATFCSQAFGAGTTASLSALYVWRAIVLQVFIFLFAFVATVLSEDILLAMGNSKKVAECSSAVVWIQLWGLPFQWLSSSFRIALVCTKRPFAGLLMSTVSSIAQLLACFVFVDPSMGQLGFRGGAYSRSLGGVVALVTLVIYIKVTGLQDIAWRIPAGAEPVMRWSAMKDFLRVSMPAALIVWSEWWAFEALTVFVARTPKSERDINIGAHGTMFGIVAVIYMIWTGMSNAMCTLVGNCIGARQNDALPPLLRAAFLCALASSLTAALSYEFGKGWLARAFTEDEEVQHAIQRNSLGLVLSIPCYAQLMTFFGVLRGANRPMPAVRGTFVGYWVIGLPCGGLLGCWLHWPTPLTGIWLGNALALCIAMLWVLKTVFLGGVDWEKMRPHSSCEQQTRQLLLTTGTNTQGADAELQRTNSAQPSQSESG